MTENRREAPHANECTAAASARGEPDRAQRADDLADHDGRHAGVGRHADASAVRR
jgi:hypothetical protein